jgi:hypothetical protein
MYDSVSLTQLTGDLSSAFFLQALGGLILITALSLILYKLYRLVMNMMEAAEQFNIQKYRNNMYYHTVCTAFKVAIIKDDAKDIKIEEEMKNIPTESNTSITDALRKQIAEDMCPPFRPSN